MILSVSWLCFPSSLAIPPRVLILNTLMFSVTGRTDAEVETPILWPPDVKNWLTGKDPDAGKDGRQEKKGVTEDEMVGWHQRLSGHEVKQALGVGDGQGGLACCSSWGCKESDTTERLNWTEPLVALCNYGLHSSHHSHSHRFFQ